MSSLGQFFRFRQPSRLGVHVGFTNDSSRALPEKDLIHVPCEAIESQPDKETHGGVETGTSCVAESRGLEDSEKVRDEDVVEDDRPCDDESSKEHAETDENKVQPKDKVEEERNSETFVAVIAQSILSVPSKRMTLSSIYNYIAKNYPHFDKEKGPGWRNSVRHNLSSNDCFVKASRAENGKGHYWMIHPKDMPEFSKGNFRRRRKPRRPKCSHSLILRESAAFLLQSAYQSMHSAPYPYTHLPHHEASSHFVPRFASAERSLAQAFRSRVGLLSSPTSYVPHHIPALSFQTPATSLRFQTNGAVRPYNGFAADMRYQCGCHR